MSLFYSTDDETTARLMYPVDRNALYLHASHPNVMAEAQEHFNATLLGEAGLEQLRETKNHETHTGKSGTSLYMGKERFATLLSSQSKRKEWMLPFLGSQSDQLATAEPFPKNNVESAVDSHPRFQFAIRKPQEKKVSKRRRHKLRHGKRRWGRGYKMLLETDGSFDNIFRNMQGKDTLPEPNEQNSKLSGTIPNVSKSDQSEGTQDSVTTEGAVMDTGLGMSESTSSPSLVIPPLYSWYPNTSKTLPHNSITPNPLPDLSWTIHRPDDQQGNNSILTYLTPTEKTKNGSVEEVQKYPRKIVNNSMLHEEITNKHRNEVLLRKVVQTLVSVASLASLPANSALRQSSQEPIDLPESNKRRAIKSLGKPRRTLQENPLLANSNNIYIMDAKSDDDIKHTSRQIYAEGIDSDSVKSADQLIATKLSVDREESNVKGSDRYISHDPMIPEVGLVRDIHSSPFLTLLSPGTTATSLEYRSRTAREHRVSSIRKRAEARAQTERNSDGDKFGRGEVSEIVAQSALLQTASHSSRFQASKDQGTMKHNYPTSSLTDAKAGSSTECYSTNDVVVAVFLTSVLNMVAFVFVTVALCWCSLRARATASAPRSLRSNDPNEVEIEDNTEETA